MAAGVDDHLRFARDEGAAQLNIIPEILLPLLVLAAFAWAIPIYLMQFFPQSLGGLLWNGIVSAALLIVLCAAYILFSWDVLERDGMPAIDTWQLLFLAAVLRGLKFSMFWGPILVLALVVQPQKWRPDL